MVVAVVTFVASVEVVSVVAPVESVALVAGVGNVKSSINLNGSCTKTVETINPIATVLENLSYSKKQ